MTNTVAQVSPKRGTARRLGLRLPAPWQFAGTADATVRVPGHGDIVVVAGEVWSRPLHGADGGTWQPGLDLNHFPPIKVTGIDVRDADGRPMTAEAFRAILDFDL